MHSSVSDTGAKQFDKSWYIDEIRDVIIPSLEDGTVSQREAGLGIYRRFAFNKGYNNKFALNPEELNEFFSMAAKAADLISEETALGLKDKLPPCLYDRLLRRKGIRNEGAAPGVSLKSIMYHKGNILIDGQSDLSSEQYGEKALYWVCGDEASPAYEAGLPLEEIYFGKQFASYPAFRIKIPVSAAMKGGLRFYYGEGLEGGDFGEAGPCPISFVGYNACLAPELGRLCGFVGPVSMEYLPGEQAILFGSVTRRKLAAQEFRGIFSLMRQGFGRKKKFLEFCLRLLYLITWPFYRRKEIWVYFDKLYMGGDNGECLFTYASSAVPGPRHYYIVNRDSEAWSRLKGRGLNVAAFKSLRNKLLTLHSSAIFATHAGVLRFAGLNPFEARFYACDRRSRVICIQHGLTIQDIPQYQARNVDNTCLYFCASHREAENLVSPAYGYEEDMVKITGLPRYDSLKSEADGTVLLAPTWRRSIVIEGNKIGDSRAKNETFCETEWYKAYSELIRDGRLMAGLRKSGSRLRFLLHPTLSSQIEDFSALIVEEGDVVEILAATDCGYEGPLRSASLLVTDYSGIQFDFAWMGKPIVYYHPDGLPPTYDTRAFDYLSEGFGPVAADKEKLVDYILDIVDNGFEQGDSYARNVDEFFVWRDFRNCERIIEEVLKFIEKDE